MEALDMGMDPRRSATAMRGLRQLRRAAGMKLYEAAEAVGVTRQTFYNWECGVSVPGPNLLYALSRMFDCSIGTLFDGREEEDDRTADEG